MATSLNQFGLMNSKPKSGDAAFVHLLWFLRKDLQRDGGSWIYLDPEPNCSDQNDVAAASKELIGRHGGRYGRSWARHVESESEADGEERRCCKLSTALRA